MAITYKVVKVKNPKGADGVDFYAGRAVKTSDYSFDELMEDIESSTTVTEADAAAVLKAIKKHVKKNLLAGRRVVLEDIGALKVNVKGKCYTASMMQEEDFQPSAFIKGVAVNFRPDAQMFKAIRSEYKLQRISSEVMP